MDDITIIFRQIEEWLLRTDRTLNELGMIKIKRERDSGALRLDAEQRYKSAIATSMKLRQELQPLANAWHNEITSLGSKNAPILAGMELLMAGSLFLENIPKSISPKAFLEGMKSFLSCVKNALQGSWREPCIPISGLSMSRKSKEYIFFYKGIVTIGELQHAIASRSKPHLFPPATLVDCQDALMEMNYSPFPIMDDTQYWKKFEGNLWLWEGIVNGSPQRAIEINDSQAAVLSKYSCLIILPNGKPGARLAN